MSLPNPREKLRNLLPEIDDDTAIVVLDFMEYLMEKKRQDKLEESPKATSISIEPLPATKPWPKDLVIRREDAYSEYRGL